MMIDTVQQFLTAYHWAFSPFAGATAVNTSYRGEHGSWPIAIETDEETGLISCWSGIPLIVSEDRRPQVGLLLSRINYGLLSGNFELDMHEGDLRFRSSRSSWQREISAEDCSMLIFSHVNTVDEFLPLIRAVAEQGLSADDVLRAAAGEDQEDS